MRPIKPRYRVKTWQGKPGWQHWAVLDQWHTVSAQGKLRGPQYAARQAASKAMDRVIEAEISSLP